MIWSRRQASDQIVQATHLSTPHPKLKLVSLSSSRAILAILKEFQAFYKFQSKFWAILSCFKGYQTAFQIFRMGRGVPLIKKMTKTEFWYN